jgi:RNase P subunit RPR2
VSFRNLLIPAEIIFQRQKITLCKDFHLRLCNLCLNVLSSASKTSYCSFENFDKYNITCKYRAEQNYIRVKSSLYIVDSYCGVVFDDSSLPGQKRSMEIEICVVGAHNRIFGTANRLESQQRASGKHNWITEMLYVKSSI